MKKVLLATTALVATAGFAMADVSLSGSAEMGIAVGPDKSADVDYEGAVIATAAAAAAAAEAAAAAAAAAARLAAAAVPPTPTAVVRRRRRRHRRRR